MCIIHCVAPPVLLVVAPLLLESYWHAFFFLLALIFATLSLSSGYRRHRHHRVAGLIGIGLLLLGAALVIEYYLPIPLLSSGTTLLGGCILITGHLLNLRYRNQLFATKNPE